MSRNGNKRTGLAGILVIGLVAIAGIGPPTVSSAATTSAGQGFAPQSKIRITARGSDFGQMLFNRNRQAIYLFDRERSKKSQCYGDCASVWPPVLTRGKPKARGKVKQKLLGTTRRRGGARQVTYAGHPLYYYAHEGPGQVFCHDVFEFGGNWLVVKPNGKPA